MTVFRCASISCTDDRHWLTDSLTDRNWRLAILHVWQFSHHPSCNLTGGNICLVCLVTRVSLVILHNLAHLWTDFQSCLALFNVDRIFHIYRPARSPKSSYQDATIFSILSLERETQWMKLFSTHTLVFIKPSFHNKENRYNNPTIW